MGSQILSLETILDDCPTQTFQTVTTINAFRDTLIRDLKQEGGGGGGEGGSRRSSGQHEIFHSNGIEAC